MHALLQDLRYGLRMLLKQPGFTLIAALTLALGIGANTALFSVVNAVLLRPLAYPNAERLMRIGRAYQPGQIYPASEPKFLFWRDHNQFRPDSRSSGHSFTVIGRLKPGVTEAQADADMKRVGENFRAAYPRLMQDRETNNIAGAQTLLVGDVRKPLLVLLGAVGFVLLIACANVANLQLAQQAARRKEMAIRLALGASWLRVARQPFVESLLLSLLGGVTGLLLSVWGVAFLKTLIPRGLIPRVEEVNFDWRVMAFNLGAAVITGLLFGLLPTLQAKRIDTNHALKEGSGKGGAAASRQRVRGALVVAEISLALVLLVGATLLIRTFANLRQVEAGFDTRNALTFQMTLSGASYDTTAKTAEFYRRALERLRALPGVEAAGVTSNLPLQAQFNLPFTLAGRSEQSGSAQYRLITPDYFRAMKIALRQGRDFTEADTAGAEGVIIVNEAFARSAFPNANPLGQRLCAGCGFGDPALRTIVGVVSDTKQFDLGSPSPTTVFIPAAQIPDQLLLQVRQFAGTIFVLRTTNDPLAIGSAVRREMLALDPTTPIRNLRSMAEIHADSVGSERFNMQLLGLFAALGLLLAAVGIYGVISYSVAQRTQEIGIRMALGAERRDVLKLVIWQGLKLTAMGVAVGVAATVALTRLMKSLLFGVSATDPVTLIATPLLLTLVALLACYVPARRATKVDPMIALRTE